MNVFQGSRNINEVFKKKLDIIQKKLNEYDYKQLKEFSKDEIEIISSLGEIENIIIDFDNPIFSTKRGSMRVKTHFVFHNLKKNSLM